MRAVLMSLLLASPLPAAASGPFMASHGHVVFSADCWFVSFTGPAFREGLAREEAENRLERPSPAALAHAKQGGIEVLAYTDSEMQCGDGPKPMRLVVEVGGKRTPIPVAVTSEVKQNALGVKRVFHTGKARMTSSEVGALFAEEATLYLILESGPFMKWEAPKRAMSSLTLTAEQLVAREAEEKQAAAVARAADEKAYAEKQRQVQAALATHAAEGATASAIGFVQRACAPGATYEGKSALINIDEAKLQAGGEAALRQLRVATDAHRDCLTKLVNGTLAVPSSSAAKLLALVGDTASLPVLTSACERQKTNQALCNAAARLREAAARK